MMSESFDRPTSESQVDFGRDSQSYKVDFVIDLQFVGKLRVEDALDDPSGSLMSISVRPPLVRPSHTRPSEMHDFEFALGEPSLSKFAGVAAETRDCGMRALVRANDAPRAGIDELKSKSNPFSINSNTPVVICRFGRCGVSSNREKFVIKCRFQKPARRLNVSSESSSASWFH